MNEKLDRMPCGRRHSLLAECDECDEIRRNIEPVVDWYSGVREVFLEEEQSEGTHRPAE